MKRDTGRRCTTCSSFGSWNAVRIEVIYCTYSPEKVVWKVRDKLKELPLLLGTSLVERVIIYIRSNGILKNGNNVSFKIIYNADYKIGSIWINNGNVNKNNNNDNDISRLTSLKLIRDYGISHYPAF